ncbi:MAG: pseudouridine synthase, partial [Hyphomicrobiaceae bacterium]
MSELHGRRLLLEADASDAGIRLDRFLAAKATGVSRSLALWLIRAGHVETAAGTITDPAVRVKPGERFEADLSMLPSDPAAPVAQAMELAIVYEDNHLIVIDKPAGLVVHPAPGHDSGTLVNALLAHCGGSLSEIGGVRRPGIVHRLDKDTSGLLVVAKTDAAHRGLAERFSAHGRDGRLERIYIGLAWGVPRRPRGTIDAPLGRSPVNRAKFAVRRDAEGR